MAQDRQCTVSSAPDTWRETAALRASDAEQGTEAGQGKTDSRRATSVPCVPPEHLDARDIHPFRISPGDTVRLAVLHHPTSLYDVSVVLEVWDIGGSQPWNSHPCSVETFFFLHGSGTAYCDEQVTGVEAGQLLVLPARSKHRIVNDGSSRLFAITTMTPDDGFAALIERGEPAVFDPSELAVFGASPGS